MFFWGLEFSLNSGSLNTVSVQVALGVGTQTFSSHPKVPSRHAFRNPTSVNVCQHQGFRFSQKKKLIPALLGALYAWSGFQSYKLAMTKPKKKKHNATITS